MRKISFILLLLPFISSAQISGTKIISTSNTDNNFKTLANAVSYINTVGVNGPVVFLLDNTTESTTATISINAIAGSSATNTLTIKPNTGKTVTINGNMPNGYTGVSAVIQFNGASNVIIDGSNTTGGTSKNLILVNNDNLSYTSRSVFWIASNGSTGSSNIKISNCKVQFANRNQEATILAGIFSGSNDIGSNNSVSGNASAAATSQVTLSNNDFINVRQGVYMIGSTVSASKTSSVTVSNNTFGSTTDATKPAVAGQFLNVDGLTITQNTISGVLLNSNAGYTTIFGLLLDTCTNFTVTKNTISDVKFTQNNGNYNAGILVKGTSAIGTISENQISNIKNTGNLKVRGIEIALDANTTSSLNIYNNIISDVAASGGYSDNVRGLSLTGKGINTYFNTIVLSGSQSTTSAAMYVAGGSVLDIRNNIFVNTSTGSTRYAIYSAVASSAFSSINYNDYYSADKVGYLGSDRTSLANWKTATGADTQSANISPVFTSDYHINATNATNLGNFDNLGTPITGITLDIDSDTRNAATPDIGADEWGPKCSGGTRTLLSVVGSTNYWYDGGSNYNASAPTANDKVIIDVNCSTATLGNLSVCELTVNANKTLTILGGNVFTVFNNITVNGTLSIEDTGSLVQVDDNATQTGSITIKKKTTPLKQYDYTYWSSPVANTSLATLVNGGSSQFYFFNAATNAWTAAAASAVMAKGVGYIARAPSNLNYGSPQTIEATFTGVPYTGVVTVPVYNTPANSYNLIGNPYPSALSGENFIKANGATAGNITGTLYFWTHKTAVSTQNPGSQLYNYASDDYSKYNLSGGVKSGSGGAVPTGNIAVGQGFFVETTASGNALFNNSMRVRTAGANNQFFRSAATTADVVGDTSPTEVVEKNRVWVSLSNEEGAYAQTLLAYITGATNGLDFGYDGATIDGGNFVMLYSILDDTKLCIQGRNVNFQDSDIIPLGFKTSITGDFKISLDQMDGLFSGDQNVYLLDKLTNTTVNLKDGAYTFNVAAAGTFDERFELRFTNETLGTDNPVIVDKKIDFITRDHGIEVMATTGNIAGLQIFDMLGRQVYSKDGINASTFNTGVLTARNQVVIAKLRTENGEIVTRKIILN